MTVFTETTHTAEFLCGELPNEMSRRAGVLNSGNNLAAGAVLARAFSGSAAAAVGSPSGTGTITIGAAGPDAQLGTYQLVCVAASSGAGTFNFYAPDGSLVRQITVGGGATVSSHYTITIADGTPDFAAGDTFEFQSTGGDYTAFDPGTNDASAILYAAVDATSADAPCVVVDHDAALVSAAIVWPDAITDDEKTAAMAQLEASGFSFR